MRSYIVIGLVKMNNPRTVKIIHLLAEDEYVARGIAVNHLAVITDIIDLTKCDNKFVFTIWQENKK